MHREKNKNLIKKNEDCKETFGFIEKKEFETITTQKIIKINKFFLNKFFYVHTIP